MASRAAFVLLTLSGIAAGSLAQAATPALVVDVDSGRVLYAERATDPWYPASITKLMTTYVALDQVRAGRLSMNSLLTLSPRAAAEPPSKMGFKPGTQLTLENALRIIMVKSANDIALMIGENVGGSVEAFADMMNETARRLGMRESRWTNPNGLPDDRQQTSARDMAILARALLKDFPEEEGLFRIGALKLGRQIIRNHNGMLGRYPGADGMKTGFICSGGFNIVSSATQNGRRIIAVVMGYPSARERDLRAADLLDTGFSSPGWGAQHVEQLPPSAAMSPPNMRDAVCGAHRRQPEEDDTQALVSTNGGRGGNADNPITALFSPFATASASNGPIGGSRRTLGPRVDFEPVPVWIGPSPGFAPEGGDAVESKPVGIAARPVRTKLLARSGATPPVSAQAFALPPANTAPVKMLKTDARPGGRQVIEANVAPIPAAQTKPKLGAIGSGGTARTRLGGIVLKPTLATKPDRDEAAAPPVSGKGKESRSATATALKPPGRAAQARDTSPSGAARRQGAAAKPADDSGE